MRATLLITLLVLTVSDLFAQIEIGKYVGYIVYRDGEEVIHSDGQLKIESFYDKVFYFKRLGETSY